MSAIPQVVWCTRGVLEQLRAYAAEQGEAVEMIGGDLIAAALRARHVPPAPDLFEPVPAVGVTPDLPNFRDRLPLKRRS